MFKAKLVSSLEKALIDAKIDSYEQIKRLSVLRGESFSVQLFYTYERDGADSHRYTFIPTVGGELAKYARLHNVRHVPVTVPVNPAYTDEGYIRKTQGLYPDLLTPISKDVAIYCRTDSLDSLWIEFNIPEDATLSGVFDLTVTLTRRDIPEETYTYSMQIEVINATLPEQELIFSQWFHCDSLANYYGVEAFSEEHWRIIENFARTAVKNGINMLLTPVFTPELDTYVGGERLTTQLVGVNKNGNRYTYSWKLLDRWLDMCNRVGIKYFEISHLFSQWGAEHAPKIMATVDGEYKQIFGWDTDAHGEEYKLFLRSFLKAFITHMKKRGEDSRLYFHVSDEPSVEKMESYKKSKKIVEPILRDYPIMDALSSVEFWKKGIVKMPIPSNNHVHDFIDAGVPGLWTYYCCSQAVKVSNRFIAMPSYRTRSIGMQMYKYNIVGFLHWGYNFYNSQGSRDEIYPFIDLSGEKWVPAGDTFSVYPGMRGEALESLRILVFKEALEDIRAMRLCETFYSHETVVAAIEKVLGATLTFDRCAYTAKEMLSVREKINEMIKKAVAKNV